MSRANLEQILELLLAEENEKAEEMLHEYVVSKARAEYEKVLDESEEEVEVEVEEAVEEEVEEAIDQSNDFEDDILADEEEIEADELGEDEDEDEMPMDMDMDMGDEEAEEGDDDIEDKVDELEAELEDLRAEFEKLLADEDGDGDVDGHEHDEDEADEEMMDSVEYDLEEAEEVDESEEELEEATKLSDKEARQPLDGKSVEADSNESPYSKAPKHTSVASQGSPVKAKDGGEGKKGEAAKDHTPTDNIKVEPKKA